MTESSKPDRLSISYLMLLTVAIAVSFCVSRGLAQLRFEADAYYHNVKSVGQFDLFGMLIASLYALSVTTLIFAVRSGNLWSSPGKTLALLFATMCLLNWGLEFVAAMVMHVRMKTELPLGVEDHRGYLLGFWYRSFAAQIGYWASLPVLIWVQFKTRGQGLIWRLAWFGFLLFAVLVIGYMHLGFIYVVDPGLRDWYFEIAIGLPVCLLIVAMANCLVRREPLDWWTVMTVVPVVSLWCFQLLWRFLL